MRAGRYHGATTPDPPGHAIVTRLDFLLGAGHGLAIAALGSGGAAGRPEGRTRVLLSDPAWVYSRPCFSPDGATVLFMRAPAGTDPVATLNDDVSRWGLWTVPAAGGQPALLFEDAELAATRPDWCAATGRIAFTGVRRDRSTELWLLDPDGRNPLRVPVAAPPGTRLLYPAWYPDGSAVAITGYPTRQVFRVAVPGGEVQQLTDPARIWAGMCSVSPLASTGHALAFAGQVPAPGGRYDSSINQVWVQGRDGVPVLLEGEQARTPSWSPRGDRIAFGSTRPRPFRFTLRLSLYRGGRMTVYVRPVGADLRPTGPAVPVTPWELSALHPRWSPDGTRLTCMLEALPGGRRGIGVVDLPSG